MHKFEIDYPTYLTLKGLKEARIKYFQALPQSKSELIYGHWASGQYTDVSTHQGKVCKWFCDTGAHFAVCKDNRPSPEVSRMQGSVIRVSKRGVGRIMKKTLKPAVFIRPTYTLVMAEEKMAVLFKLTL